MMNKKELLLKLMEKSAEENDYYAITVIVNDNWISGELINANESMILLKVDFTSYGVSNLAVDIDSIDSFGFISDDDSEILVDLFE